MMDKKDLRHLRRRDLLEMLLDLTKENERLQETNKQLEAVLGDRTITILESGSLAEAALRLSGVFKAAQDAADQYLFNAKQRCQRMEEEAQRKCEQMLAEAENEAKRYEEEKHE